MVQQGKICKSLRNIDNILVWESFRDNEKVWESKIFFKNNVAND